MFIFPGAFQPPFSYHRARLLLRKAAYYSRRTLTKFARTGYCLDYSSLETRGSLRWQRNKMESWYRDRRRKKGRERQKAIGNLRGLDNRVSLKRGTDSFARSVLNSATTSKQIIRRGLLFIASIR